MNRFQSIVVPTDFSAHSEAAAARAVGLARVDGASIHLVHAVSFLALASPYDVCVPSTVLESVQRAAREDLEEVRRGIEANGIAEVTAEAPETMQPVQAIASAVEAHGADLVVMGTHGRRGIKHTLLGSVAERTIRTLGRPVLAVKESPSDAERPIQRILLATDFSGNSRVAGELAGALAARLGASVDILHVIEATPYYAAYIKHIADQIEASAAQGLEALEQAIAGGPAATETHLRRGLPSEVISETARSQRSDLIVIGTRGNTGLEHVLLGSVAERTLRAAPCSVLAVPERRERSD